MATTIIIRNGLDANLAGATGTNGEPFFTTDTHKFYVLWGGTKWEIGGNAGTVTSVGLSLPSIFNVSGSPVTGSGTLSATLAAQAANTVLAGPTTGSAAAPTIRALVAADIPDMSGVYQPLSTRLTNFAGLATGGILVADGSSGYETRTITGTTNVIDVTNGSGVSGNPTITISSSYTGQTSIVTVGTIATGAWHGTAVDVLYGGTGATTASGARTNLGLAIGTNVQAYSANLNAMANATSAADTLFYFTGSGTGSVTTFTSLGRAIVGSVNEAVVRANLTWGTAVYKDSTGTIAGGGNLPTENAVETFIYNLIGLPSNPWKQAVRVASTVNITLSGIVSTVDGVSIVTGDRVLLKNQTTTSENGIYTQQASGRLGQLEIDWNLPTYSKGARNATVAVREGSTQADTVWMTTDDGATWVRTYPTTNADTATALATPRTINGVSFDGTGNITVTAAAGTLTGTTLNATVVTTSITSTGTLTGGATGAGFTVALGTSTITGTLPAANMPAHTGDVTSTAGSVALTIGAGKVTNAMLAGSIDLTTKVMGILPPANGGTNNAFTAFTGPTTSTKTYTLPNATCTILTDNTAVTAAQGGTGIASYAVGDILYASGTTALSKLAAVAVGKKLVSKGTTTAPAWEGFVGVSLYKSANQSIGAGTFTTVTFDTENYDTNSFHDTVTNNSRITIPTGYGGYYRMSAAVQFASNASGGRGVRFLVNGTTNPGPITVFPAVNGDITHLFFSWVLNLAAGDYVECQAYQTSGGSLNVNGAANATYFAAEYLGA